MELKRTWAHPWEWKIESLSAPNPQQPHDNHSEPKKRLSNKHAQIKIINMYTGTKMSLSNLGQISKFTSMNDEVTNQVQLFYAKG